MQKTIYADEYRALLAWLREQRKRRGLSMRDLAQALGVHHSWVGRIEQGERRLDIVEFARLCRALGCDPQEGLRLALPPENACREPQVAESRDDFGKNAR